MNEAQIMGILLSINNETWNLILLALTFGAILWYSYETRKLRVETSELRKIQSRPYVTFFINDTWDANKSIAGQHFYVKNSGQGLAKNISLTPIAFTYKYGLDKKSEKTFQIKSFDFLCSLSPQETMEVFAEKDASDVVERQGNKKVDPRYIRISENPRSQLRIDYCDLRGQSFFTEIEVSPNYSKVVKDSFLK